MTNVYVFDVDTNAPIEGATVTCTGMPSQETGADGYASFDTEPFIYYTFTANADHYIEPSSQYVMGADPYIEFRLHRKIITHTLITTFLYDSGEWQLENVTITVTDSETGGALYNESCTSYYISYMHNYGCSFELAEGVEYIARAERTGYHIFTTTFVAEAYGDTTLALLPRMPTVVTEAANLITETTTQLNGLLTDLDGLASVGFHFHYWGGGLDEYTHIGHHTGPSSHASHITDLQPDTLYSYQAIGINDSDVFALYSYGEIKQFTTLAELTHDMRIILPNANGKLFLSNTIIACDDWHKACTDFNFQIRNDGNDQMLAWYKVSIIGGATLYEDRTRSLIPGGLPVGTHTIKVEVGPAGQAATDTYTEDLYVLEDLPTIETISATQTDETTVMLEGNLTHMADSASCNVYFMLGLNASCTVSSKDYDIFDTLTTPSIYQLNIGGIPVGATLYYKAAADCPSHTTVYGEVKQITLTEDLTYDITFIATAPGISDLHDVDVTDVTNTSRPIYLGRT